MSSLKNVLVSAVGLAAMTSALPTTIDAREECPTGTWRSVCGSINGCFDHDACQDATGGTPPTPASNACTPGTSGTSTLRSMHVVLPSDPDYSTDDVGYFQVQTGDMEIYEVGVFGGIPQGAQSCAFEWKHDRAFTVEGNGLLSVRQLEGLDTAKPITWAAVEKAKEIGGSLSPDLTNWQHANVTAQSHLAGAAVCAESMAFRFEAYLSEDQPASFHRNVFMEQDEDNGFYINWQC